MKPEYLHTCGKIGYRTYSQANERIIKQSRHRRGGMRIKTKFGFGPEYKVSVYKCENPQPYPHFHVGKTVKDKPRQNRLRWKS